MNPPGRDNVVSQMRERAEVRKLQDNGRRKTTARNTKKAALLRRVITVGYYSPAEILLHVLLFIPCRPRLPARAFFVHKKAPPERGWRVALCAIAWCRVPPGEFSPVTLNPHILAYDHQRDHTVHQSPLRTGGFTMRNFFNKCSV